MILKMHKQFKNLQIDGLDVQVVSLVGSWDEANAGDVLE